MVAFSALEAVLFKIGTHILDIADMRLVLRAA